MKYLPFNSECSKFFYIYTHVDTFSVMWQTEINSLITLKLNSTFLLVIIPVCVPPLHKQRPLGIVINQHYIYCSGVLLDKSIIRSRNVKFRSSICKFYSSAIVYSTSYEIPLSSGFVFQRNQPTFGDATVFPLENRKNFWNSFQTS